MAGEALKLLRTYMEITPKLDADKTLALFSPDVIVTTPLMPNAKPLVGMAALKQIYRAVYSHFRTFKWRNEMLYATDDPELAIARCSATAVLSNGTDYENDYCIFLRAREGKVIEIAEYFSPIKAAMVSQSEPAPAK